MSPRESKIKTIFGPVHSRRFGVSLGIDLSPSLKQCNFDCLYCELAPAATMQEQQEVVNVDTVVAQLQEALQSHENIDVITITANGEPTLYPHLNTLVARIKALHGIHKPELLILTNSATLGNIEIYNTLMKFDQVKLSLDAVSKAVFEKIDRPDNSIDIDDIILHVTQFSQEFKGKLFIEILFVKGLNDTPEEIAKLSDVLLHVKSERIDIGTVDRPPAYAVQALNYNELLKIATHFDTTLPIHIASRHNIQSTPSAYSDAEILNTLDKRPLSESDVAILFDAASQKRLQTLCELGSVTVLERSHVLFYVPTKNLKRKRSKS